MISPLRRLLQGPFVVGSGSVLATTAALMYRRSLVEKFGGFRDDLPVIRVQPQKPAVARPRAVLARRLAERQTDRGGLARPRPVVGKATRGASRHLRSRRARPLRYFEAVELQRSLGMKLALHPRIAAPLARVSGCVRRGGSSASRAAEEMISVLQASAWYAQWTPPRRGITRNRMRSHSDWTKSERIFRMFRRLPPLAVPCM